MIKHFFNVRSFNLPVVNLPCRRGVSEERSWNRGKDEVFVSSLFTVIAKWTPNCSSKSTYSSLLWWKESTLSIFLFYKYNKIICSLPGSETQPQVHNKTWQTTQCHHLFNRKKKPNCSSSVLKTKYTIVINCDQVLAMCRSGAVWEMCVNTIFQGVDINVGREMIRETAKAWELLTLHAPVSILNVNRHVSRKGLNKYRFFGRSAGESLYSLSKKKFRFAKLHMNKPQNISGTMHFGQMRTEWRCVPIMHKTKLSISPQTPQTNCLHCGWDVMICIHRKPYSRWVIQEVCILKKSKDILN